MQFCRKPHLLIAALPFFCGILAHAQKDSGIVLRSSTRLVEVEVLVRDSSGKPVEDLKKDDFTILDNGKSRAFPIFSVNRAGFEISAPQPATPARAELPPNHFSNIGEPAPSAEGKHATIILLDGVNGWFESFVWGSKGIQGLMDKLPADERIAVYVIDRFEGLLQVVDYTTDRELVKKTMKTFIPRGMRPGPPGMGLGPDGEGLVDDIWYEARIRSKGYLTGGQREFEAQLRLGAMNVQSAFSALAERLRTVPGRKSVFWVTEGFPPRIIRNDRPAWDKTMEALNNANIAVNTVDADGLGGPNRLWGAGGIISMKFLAHNTGGQAFYHRNDIDGALAEGVASSRSSYTLGFYAGNLDGKYHELKVRVDRPGLTLDHRQGYYAQTDAMQDSASRKTELESALVNPMNLLGVGITARIEMKAGNLVVHLRLNPESVSLTQAAGFWTGRLEELFVERTATGRQLADVKQTTQIKIGPAGKEDFDRRGLVLTQTMRYVSGATTLAIVIRDAANGRTGSLTLPLKSMQAASGNQPAQ